MSAPVSDDMRAAVRAKLADIEREEQATILLAVESGSRAWGFHSPDSDYDVRFIYARPIDWHLSVAPGRDVIERPISDELDLSGWDLRKTLGLILRSNAVTLEWLQSPIVYREAEGFREALTDYGRRVLRRRPVTWHYLRLAESQFDRMKAPGGGIRLKKLFYVLRPALALRWLRLHAEEAAPPMDMARLLAEAAPDAAAMEKIHALIARKAMLKEMGEVDAPPAPVIELIQRELEAARAALARAAPDARQDDTVAADALHRYWVRRADDARNMREVT